jgi:hypothetical protein
MAPIGKPKRRIRVEPLPEPRRDPAPVPRKVPTPVRREAEPVPAR